ncbi:MAG: adenine phosphoribosyltransferase [Myxococcota bacterium]
MNVAESIRAQIVDVPDFPKPGITFKDLTPVFAHGPTHRAMIDALAERYHAQDIHAVVGVESRGFLLAAPVAYALGVGTVLVRKRGKLPRTTRAQRYELEYGHDHLEIHSDALVSGQKVVIVDDLLATGGTMVAARTLVQDLGAEVVEAAFVVELGFLPGRKSLSPMPVHALLRFD